MRLLSYKGYTAEVVYDAQEGILYGHVLDLRDTITFQSESAAEIVDEFHTSVDEYLALSAEQEIEPAKPYSGTLYIRTDPDVHREATIAAAQEGKASMRGSPRSLHRLPTTRCRHQRERVRIVEKETVRYPGARRYGRKRSEAMTASIPAESGAPVSGPRSASITNSLPA